MAPEIDQPVKLCSHCLVMSTRPRVTFDKEGLCNACVWSEEKKNIDWESRNQELLTLLEKHRGKSSFDCVVPVSGGKDGSYVAYQLKEKYGMKPLCVTVNPPLQTSLGQENLRAFQESGFDLVSISPHPETLRELNLRGFTEIGFPYFGWLTAIQTSVLKLADNFGISLIFYGEDGEVEYGGSSETKTSPIYDEEYMARTYLEGGLQKVFEASELRKSERYWFEFPGNKNLQVTHWSYFENWDPYRNYLVAKEHCGLRESEDMNEGTFTNYAQNDQELYSLHTYMMFLKFGFGRANQDASIDIRRGAMDRNQGLNLVKLFDGQFPENSLSSFLDYFRMPEQEFNDVLDRFANKKLLKKIAPGRWKRNFDID